MMVACAGGKKKTKQRAWGDTDNSKERQVPPRRCLLVLSHQLHVDIRLFRGAVHVLLPYVLSVVKIRIYNEGGDGSE